MDRRCFNNLGLETWNVGLIDLLGRLEAFTLVLAGRASPGGSVNLLSYPGRNNHSELL